MQETGWPEGIAGAGVPATSEVRIAARMSDVNCIIGKECVQIQRVEALEKRRLRFLGASAEIQLFVYIVGVRANVYE